MQSRKTFGTSANVNWDDIDEMPPVTDEELFPYGHGPTFGD